MKGRVLEIHTVLALAIKAGQQPTHLLRGDLGLRIYGFRVKVLGFRIYGFMVWDFGFRVEGLGFTGGGPGPWDLGLKLTAWVPRYAVPRISSNLKKQP